MRLSVFSISVFSISLLHAQDAPLTQEQLAFFESKIRPVLADACYECHSNEGGRVKGGLALDTREALFLGGDSGDAVVPGHPDDSLLWAAISYTDPDYEMPPKNRLDPAIVSDFKKWIEMGAPDPRVTEKIIVKSEIDIEKGREFWSFQKPKNPPVPEVEKPDWANNVIDYYILAKLEEKSMAPAVDASPETLVRRLYFDLIGLPPTPEQQVQFQKSWAENPHSALQSEVEKLLASPGYGERWGRHWLDVARYAESTGKETNMTYPHAWRYRDYVIDSFNEDKPYDRFIAEQIAGDLLPARDDVTWQENLIATGFLAMGTKGLNQESGHQFRMDVVDEQIDTMTQAILGLTVSCARCHDHKFDPVPTTDYYALAGIFLSSETFFGTVPNAQNKRSSDLLLLPVPDPFGEPMAEREIAALEERRASMRREMIELRQMRDSLTGNAAGDALQKALRMRNQQQIINAKLQGVDENGMPKTFAMGVQDGASPTDTNVLLRGEIDKPAQKVSRGFVQVLYHDEMPEIKSGSSGRRELAEWITSKENALTARVMANRVWLNLFGRGIVNSPDNFGTTGQAPTHPELLDYLAVRFMENGWSVKSLIREIVLSRTYRMSSDFNSKYYTMDPDNNYLWRANQRRLDAEAIRDTILAASGTLDRSRPRGSLIAEIGDARVGIRLNERDIDKPSEHRSVYLPVVRDALPEALALFDFAEPDVVRGSRESTNVPSQALYMMNNSFVTQQAKAMAEDLIAKYDSPRERIGAAFRRAYGRMPTSDEVESTMNFFREFFPASVASSDRAAAVRLTMATFCQGLFSSAEFRYLY
ncbi:MAG: PSD1 and planctomycete cytochrome C domain-containing protein [Verrucomicrobiales bacterium]|nr:PSD1 and planctomycete cytochrome C domain-containing protein [Verrucomicrobiales bacterium]